MSHVNPSPAVLAAPAIWSEPLAEGRPLVICLHGYSATEVDVFALTKHLGPRPVFVSLRGPSSSITPYPGYAWFMLPMARSGALLGAGNTEADYDAVATIDAGATTAANFVLTWLDAILAQGPAPSSIGLVGVSQGGVVAAQMLRMHPERFGATVLLMSMVAPGLHVSDERITAVRPPLFIGWGGHDPVIPRMATRNTLDWAREATTLTEYGEPGVGHEPTRAQLAAAAAFLDSHLA